MLRYSKSYHYLDDILVMAQLGWVGRIYIRMLGSRWSSKTKSAQIFALKAIHMNINVQVACTKYTVKKARSFFKEMEDTMREYGINTTVNNKTERSIKYKGNEIIIMGYKTNKSEAQGALGEFRPINPDLLIVFIDEISEFDNSNERSLIHQAVGGGKLTVYVDASNPWSEFNWFVNECTMRQKFDEEAMKNPDIGETFNRKIIRLDKQNKVIDMEVMHYTNHNINEFLTEEQHDLLRREWDIDPDMARVTDWGLPGIEQGAVYSHQMKRVRNYEKIDYNASMGGMDWINDHNHMVLLISLNDESYDKLHKANIRECLIYGLDSRTLVNSMDPNASWEPLQHPAIEDMVIKFVVKVYQKYGLSRTEDPMLEIGVDNSCSGAIAALNEKLYAKGLSHGITFHKATKDEIRERINLNKRAMGKDIVKVHPSLTTVIGALESLKWDEKMRSTDPRDKTGQLIIDINDAFDYMMYKKRTKIAVE